MPTMFTPDQFKQPALVPDGPRTEAEFRSAEPASAVAVAPEADPRNEKSYTFAFRYTDQRNRVIVGTFTNKILSMYERSRVAVMSAQLGGGLPASALEPVAAERNYVLAFMTFSLDPKRPDWAKDLLQIDDENLLYALWKEVCSHEQFYFRGSEESGASAV